jgi:hypothetical protein
MPKCYKQDESRIIQLGELPASKSVNTEVEEATALEAVTRQRLVKTQQIEKA